MNPDYKKIYEDILKYKKPEKTDLCKKILEKEKLAVLDVITLNTIIFGTYDKERFRLNQKHRSYDKDTVLQILEFQKISGLTNTAIALKFKLSRNTVAKWKKLNLSH